MSDRCKISFLSSNCYFYVSSHVSTFSRCPTNGELAHRLRMMMKMVRGSHDDVNDDDDDHHHDDQR